MRSQFCNEPIKFGIRDHREFSRAQNPGSSSSTIPRPPLTYREPIRFEFLAKAELDLHNWQ
jgi:hypothetical protein